MKKFIQVCSLFAVLVFFGAVSANAAETAFASEVEIPFAFNIGERSHEAGSYIVRLDRLSSSTARLTIENADTNEVNAVLLNVIGEAPDKQVNLVFDIYEGRRYLSKVRTMHYTFSLVDAKPSKNVPAGGADLF